MTPVGLIAGNFLPTTSVFTSDEYRAWLSRTPSTSAIYDKLKYNRDNSLLRQKNRFTYSAENLPERTRQVMKMSTCFFFLSFFEIIHRYTL